jgi:3-hydroxybutyryl-CoA dehydrogenase
VTLKRIAVIGAGTMGSGIAQVCAVAGYEVVLSDADGGALQRAGETIASRLHRLVERGELAAAERSSVLTRLCLLPPPLTGQKVDLAIESVPERMDLKQEVLSGLDRDLHAEAILVSNTSGLDIGQLAAASRRPERVMGMHFFNPPPAMPLIELVRTPQTSEEVFRTVWRFAESLGKTPIAVANRPGFAVNRILIPMINEAIFALEEGIASPEDIDRAMNLGARHPIGPLALADFIGLDVVLDILESFQARLDHTRYRPCALLRDLVSRGDLGRKSGQGFFTHP